ncbi:two-component system response regulator [Thiomicrospira microaerophila]|uniref:two-component system response regulator n=1 Tax=Thiomicrospira microaerophila TaxID=406020 RepID=UPI000AEEDB39|nr:EAL domain-containing protein [Thiomicrospira microaerophila]
MSSEKQVSVLLVDDDPVTRSLIKQLLKKLVVGVLITEAENGEEALEKIAQLKTASVEGPVVEGVCFDYIFLDLMMPVMDGVEFLRHYALQEQVVKTRLILLSASETMVLESAMQYAKMLGLEYIAHLSKSNVLEAIKPLASQMSSVFEEAVRSSMSVEAMPNRGQPQIEAATILAAIELKQFEVFYQPKHACIPRDKQGVEALLRWTHPEWGAVSPALFIPIAEQQGVIDVLTDHVLDRVLDDLVGWREQGFNDLVVSINLSPKTLNDLNLPSHLEQSVAAKGVSPDQLMLEITETAQETCRENFTDTLLRLRLKGFRLSMDDFGTGTSSMARLQQLPFSEIKIDRSFITNIEQDDKKQSIVAHMIGMGQKLGLTIVVEGLETQSELDFVNTLKPDYIQGYFFSRPLNHQAMQAWLVNKRLNVAD